MKQLVLLITLLSISIIANAQNDYTYEPNADYPYGRPNPEAPPQMTDWQERIGSGDCKSETRNPDGTWNPPAAMIWTFKYIMNGMAVQDEVLVDTGRHAGSIRQFIADSSRWFVHYYSNILPSTTLPVWEGNRKDDQIILYKDQTAPNGMEGKYRITFSEMTYDGFKWNGDWVNPDETIVYPTFKIVCRKRKD